LAGSRALLPREEIDAALAGDLAGWHVSGEDGGSITREVEVSSFLAGIKLVVQVAEAAEELDHHPDIDIRYTTLRFTLSTHSAGGLTARDLELAGRIDRLSTPGPPLPSG
jgi:4a-hydroxytetrahydrobiopterin dehydratase